ncbi:Gmad2 immunoglobulin-like domain-containing protein [Pseudonocardia sp. GCM10023141]
MRRVGPIGLLGVLVLVLAGCSGASAPVPVAPAATTVATPTPTPTPGQVRALPVYYASQTPSGLRLYREFHRVTTVDPVSDAVRELFTAPLDPDYRTLWPSGVALRAPVTSEAGVTTVDLYGVDGTRVAADAAPFAVQQLVLTVQGARQSTDPVRVLVDGRAVNTLWTVPATAPIARGDVYALRSLVQIDDPAQGATVGRDVVVSGEAAVFEATVHWEVLRGSAVVRSGVASSAEGQKFAPYRFTITLEPGQYTVRVREDDPSDGAGRPVLTDDKAFTVGG